MPAKKRKPSYLLHKATGQARVRIDGRDVYLGTYGSPESRQRYDDIVCEWLTKNEVVNATLTVDDLCLLFMKFAESYYLRKDGTPTGSIRNIREGLRFVIRLHGSTLVHQFGPRKLKAVRQAMIGDGRARTNINRLTHWIRRVFRWGVENEYVAASVYEALRAVPSLKIGRTEAVESDPVEPVEESIVKATLPHLPVVVADMVRLQLLSGARPSEIRNLRPCDVSFGVNGVWTYPPRAKTTAAGHQW